MLTLDFLTVPILCAVLSNVWISLLCKPGKLFEAIPFYFQTHITQDKKINYVLFDCAACLSGQLSFWYVLFDQIIAFNPVISYPLWSIVFSIFLGAVFTKLIIHD